MLENISQLKLVDSNWLDQITTELQEPATGLESLWQEPYPEYASGSLKVATLLNPTGEQENFDYKDCKEPKATPLLRKLPSLASFLESGALNIMGARLLRIDPGTFFHEHRDFVYMEKIQRYRLHLPLITNDQAFITSPGINVHFQRGFLWKLDPKATVHSACNFGTAPRIHLMLDCYVNDHLANLLQGQFLDEKLKHRLPPLTGEKRSELIAAARLLLKESQGVKTELIEAAESILLKTFCQFNLQAHGANLTSYDLIFELFQEPAYQERRNYWQQRLLEVYPADAGSAPAQSHNHPDLAAAIKE
jgi:Aspartyl/Asparaginyl beta-hydroxylase